MAPSKYARVEIECRFLLAGVPEGVEISAVHEIDDRYLDGQRPSTLCSRASPRWR